MEYGVALFYVLCALATYGGLAVLRRPAQWPVRFAPGEKANVNDTIAVEVGDGGVRRMTVVAVDDCESCGQAVDLRDERAARNLMTVFAVLWPVLVPIGIASAAIAMTNSYTRSCATKHRHGAAVSREREPLKAAFWNS